MPTATRRNSASRRKSRATAKVVKKRPKASAILTGHRAARKLTPAEVKTPFRDMPDEVQQSVRVLTSAERRLHGAKFPLAYFKSTALSKPCADMFGYMSPANVRSATKLPFSAAVQGLLEELGNLMADAGREGPQSSAIPAGFTYVGQFVDHDISLDVESTLDVATDANTIHNLRTPALELDSLYGSGPALAPFLYSFPATGNPSAIKLQLGTNLQDGIGGPAGSSGTMKQQTDFDVPRTSTPAHTAIIGDPRNDENLIVVQFHQAMLRFHNAVVDKLIADGFTGDVFIEAKRLVTHHYQWAVVNDFLKRVCGAVPVTNAIASVNAPINSAFRMPVEFSVAAYRFGHSMVRDSYWISFKFPGASLAQVFAFNRAPNLPVRSSWVVDLNAFFETGVVVPVNNKARKIDSVLAFGLESLPGFSGLMAVLAARNLRRGLALGLPSGQGMAKLLKVPVMTQAQLTQDLPANEVAVLQKQSNLLLKKTPLWYYILREAAVMGSGETLGPLGGKIVATTFARVLKRDAASYLNAPGGFTPSLPASTAGDFTFADLVKFARVTEP
jgi:hypothetical protein